MVLSGGKKITCQFYLELIMADIVQAANLIVQIKELARKLPVSIPEATRDSYVYHVLTNTHGEGHWETFNRRFDLLYGKDCIDAKGQLQNIERGKFGMLAVCKYLDRLELDASWFAADLACIKFERILSAMKALM